VNEEKELWNLVRGNLFDKQEKEIVEDKERIQKEIQEEKIEEHSKDLNEPEILVKEENTTSDFASKNLFSEGIFASVIYIFAIMVVLGILTLPGTLTAAVGGFFGGKKAGDPARALTAAMLPFLIIAGLYFLASSGALPPGSGPNDVADEIGNLVGYNPSEDTLGPISKIPDSNSSVFLSLVTFAFIGGLVQTENRISTNKINISD
tara:strand:+ start:942 stop:1559 length:618 start_codon:yes stop_codon:yes gene_type:complete